MRSGETPGSFSHVMVASRENEVIKRNFSTAILILHLITSSLHERFAKLKPFHSAMGETEACFISGALNCLFSTLYVVCVHSFSLGQFGSHFKAR